MEWFRMVKSSVKKIIYQWTVGRRAEFHETTSGSCLRHKAVLDSCLAAWSFQFLTEHYVKLCNDSGWTTWPPTEAWHLPLAKFGLVPTWPALTARSPRLFCPLGNPIAFPRLSILHYSILAIYICHTFFQSKYGPITPRKNTITTISCQYHRDSCKSSCW